MKKLTSVLTLAALAVGAFSLSTSQAATTTATIALPAPFAGTTLGVNNGTTNTEPDDVCTPDQAGCQKGSFARLARCAYLADQAAGTTASQDSSSGKFGYVVRIPAGSTTFNLHASPANSADFDVTFYPDLGACDSQKINRSTPPINRSPDGGPTSCDNSTNTIQTSWSHFGNGAESGSLPHCYKIDPDDGVTHVALPVRFAIVTLWGDQGKVFTLTVS